jgi:putative flippase GtrA
MVKFGLVGFVNAGVDAAIFFLALATVTNSLVVANTCAWVVAVTCSYVLNSLFTFAVKSVRELSLRGYFMFALTQVGGFLAHTTVLVVTAAYLPLPLAKLIGIGVGFLVNFTLARAFVFHAR